VPDAAGGLRDLVDDLARALTRRLCTLGRDRKGALDRGADSGDGVVLAALAALRVLLVLLLVLRHGGQAL
jgi:hypothetical protein